MKKKIIISLLIFLAFLPWICGEIHPQSKSSAVIGTGKVQVLLRIQFFNFPGYPIEEGKISLYEMESKVLLAQVEPNYLGTGVFAFCSKEKAESIPGNLIAIFSSEDYDSLKIEIWKSSLIMRFPNSVVCFIGPAEVSTEEIVKRVLKRDYIPWNNESQKFYSGPSVFEYRHLLVKNKKEG